MKKQFDQLCSKIISTFLSEKTKEVKNDILEKVEDTKEKHILIDVDWSDIGSGVSESCDNSIISRALRKHGYHGTVAQSYIVLEDGSTYIPENLTDHWELFYGSKKAKPAVLSYQYLEE